MIFNKNINSSQRKRYHFPKTLIARFVARRTLKSTSLWGLVFIIYVASKAEGFVKAYPTAQARANLAHSFSKSIGLNALLGTPHSINTAPGFVAWNALNVLTIIGSIWALLLATKYFRGEEESGRSEALLAGQTTHKLAALNTLSGLSISLVVFYLITAVGFSFIGHLPGVGFNTISALYLALACTVGTAIFLTIGALTSQIMPTRTRASGLAAFLFGLFFLIRAMADVTTMHWLLDLSPLGWIEKLQPLSASHPIWLLPIFGLIGLLGYLSILFASRRDLNDSLLADKDSAPAKTNLLKSPFLATLRLSKSNIIAWLGAITLLSTFYGLLTNSAVQAVGSAKTAQKVINRVTGNHHANINVLFISVVFIILTPAVMALTASLIAKVRDDEAQGYIDNYLVQPISRWRLLIGRINLIFITSFLACLLTGTGIWIGQAHEHVGLTFHTLFLAGLNIFAPVLFSLSLGVLAFGLKPRLTSLAAYGIIAWSFLLTIISNGLNLNHWLLDTSIMHQIALVPAANPNWKTNSFIILISLGLIIFGLIGFHKRDLQAE